MNREHEFVNDPMFEPETPEVSERLDRIEQRLKATRPQPPRLDALVLERLASEPVVGVAARPIVSVRMATIAGSWACGALVGALVMFLLLNPAVSKTDPTQEAVRIEKEPPVPPPPIVEEEAPQTEEPPPPKQIDRVEMDSTVLALTLGRFGIADSPYLKEGPTLRAGMLRTGNAVGRAANATREVRPRESSLRVEASTDTNRAADPAPPTTRRQLMRDLLGKSPEFVL